jgi:hypothetical protein
MQSDRLRHIFVLGRVGGGTVEVKVWNSQKRPQSSIDKMQVQALLAVTKARFFSTDGGKRQPQPKSAQAETRWLSGTIFALPVLSTRAALQNSFGKQQHQFLAQSRLRSTCSPSSLSPIPTRQNLNQPECLTAIPSAPASPPTQT